MRRVIVPLLVISLFLLLPFGQVEALGISGLSVTAMDCVGFTFSAYTATFDRDNTGTGSEAYELTVRDSAGTLLYLSSSSTALGTYPVDGGSITYNLASPVNGDLTLRYTSLAGNGLEEQIAYSFTGFCAIPTATPSPTATPTPTPIGSPTPTPTASATANYVLRATYVYGDSQSQDVAFKMEVTPADAVQIGLLSVIAGLLAIQIFRDVFRGRK